MRRPTESIGPRFRLGVLWIICVPLCLSVVNIPARAADDVGPPLPGTKPLTMTGDIASELVAGVDRFLLKEIDASTAKRASYWKRDSSSVAAYNASIEPNRKRLAHVLGVRDERRLDVERVTMGRAPDPKLVWREIKW